jgi:carotenoid cleavage dioxygenase-like enzyme
VLPTCSGSTHYTTLPSPSFCFPSAHPLAFQPTNQPTNHHQVPIQGNKGRTRIHLVPRASGRFAGEPPLTLETRSAFMTHWASAWTEQSAEAAADPEWPEGRADRLVAFAAGWDGEQLLAANRDGKLFGELCETSPGPDFSRLPIIRLHRLELDLRSRTANFDIVPRLSRTFVDFPKAHPAYEVGRPTRHLWMTASNDVGISSPPQGFVRFDAQTNAVDSWHAPGPRAVADQPHVYVSEAVLAARAPRIGEDPELAAYLLALEFDGRTGRRSLCVFEAGELGKGPVCRLHLKPEHALPWGIHNEFAPEVLWDGEPLS